MTFSMNRSQQFIMTSMCDLEWLKIPEVLINAGLVKRYFN